MIPPRLRPPRVRIAVQRGRSKSTGPQASYTCAPSTPRALLKYVLYDLLRFARDVLRSVGGACDAPGLRDAAG
jgi:hypothetical protein